MALSIVVSASAALAAVLLLVACGGAPGGSQAPSPAAEQPSLVLISVDGLRTDQLGCYGGEPSLTPALDAFAQKSRRFEFAFTQSPSVAPALASLYTSMYPTSHGLAADGDVLREEAETAAELLAAQGFATGWFSSSTDEPARQGLLQGFGTVSSDGVAGAARWLAEQASGRFFLAYHVDQVTDPSAVDAAVGELLQVLEGEGLSTRTAVAVVSTRGVPPAEQEAPLALAVVHVPMLVREPGQSSPASVSQFVELIDVAPTMFELAGVATPVAAQGASLVPLMRGEGQPPYIAFGELSGELELRFVALGGHRLVTDVASGELHLYDLMTDPSESTDIAGVAAGEQALRRMQSDLEAWSKMVAAASLDPDRRTEELDEETLEQLKSLGYIQ